MMTCLCKSIDNNSPYRQFNITINHPVGSYIGSIVSNDNLSSMQAPFYIVPIIPEDSNLLEKYVSIDLETGKITLNSELKNITLIKFSVLSINEGTALTIIINVLNQKKTMPESTTTSRITTTITITTTDNPINTIKTCVNLSLNGSTIGKSDNDCYSIDTKPLNKITQSKCNLSNDLKQIDLGWTGILVPTCDNDNYGISLIYIDRSTIENYDMENSQSSIFMSNDVKYPDRVDYSLIKNTNQDLLQVKNIVLDVKCSKTLNKKLKIDVDRNDIDKSDFLLLNTNHKYLLSSNPVIIDYLANNFKNFNNQNKSNFIIFTKYAETSSTDSNCLDEIENKIQIKTSTSSSTSTFTYSVIILTETTATTTTSFKPILTKKEQDKSDEKFNLRLFLIALATTVSCLIVILYMTFLLFKKRNIKSTSTSSIATTHSTIESNKYNCRTNMIISSSNFNSLRLNSNEDEDDLVREKSTSMFEKFFGGFMSLPSRHITKLSGSLSANTMLTRASTSTDTNILNSRDFSSKHSMMTSSLHKNNFNHHDCNLESLTGLKVNEIVQDQDFIIQDHVIVSDVASNNCGGLFVYSDNYLNQMGINMMDNIKSLNLNNPESSLNNNNNNSVNIATNNEYIDLNYNKWSSLLNWKLDMTDFKDVLDELAQLNQNY